MKQIHAITFNDLFEPETEYPQPVKTELLKQAAEEFEINKRVVVRDRVRILLRDSGRNLRRSQYANT